MIGESTRSRSDSGRRFAMNRSLAGFVSTIFVLLTILSAASSISSAQPPATDSSKSSPTSARQRPFDGPTFIIVDDPKKLGDLFERLDTPDFQLIRPKRDAVEAQIEADSDSFVRSVSIRGEVLGSIADLTLTYEIQQVSPGKIFTAIGLDGLTLRSAATGTGSAVVTMLTDQGEWAVRTDSVGVHKIVVSFGVDISSDRSTRRLAFAIPEAASTELALKVPEQVLFATTNSRDSLQVKFDAAKDIYEVSGLLTPRPKLELRWLGQSLIRRDDEVRLECRGQVSIRMDLDAVSTRQSWQIRPLTGQPTRLVFRLAEGESLTDILIDGRAARPVFESGPKGFVTVSLDKVPTFNGPNADPVNVELVTKIAYPVAIEATSGENREFKWFVPRWDHGEIVSGTLALELPDKWIHVAQRQNGLDPVDPRDLPDRLRKSPTQPAFRFYGPNVDPIFRIRRRRPPLFTNVRTIGIVRRSQVEYVSDFAVQGEIDPLREYEIALDRASRPLFIGPRDTWERYEDMGESVIGDRKFRRLRLTPNKSLKPEQTPTLRIRYFRSAESPESFALSLPRFVDATEETHRVWLIPEPSLAIEPTDASLPVRFRLPASEATAFSNLLEQTLTDEDKWIKPRNATELNSLFFRPPFPFERETRFRSSVRPPSLDYAHRISLRPNDEVIHVVHEFDCVLEQGGFERIVLNPGKGNTVRSLRYTLRLEGATQSGNLILQDGSFEITLPSDIARRFSLSLESFHDWNDLAATTPAADGNEGSKAPLDTSRFDLSIVDGQRIQKSLQVDKSPRFAATLVGPAAGWSAIANANGSTDVDSTTWLSPDPAQAWPSIRFLPVVSASAGDPSRLRSVRAIEAVVLDATPPILSVDYILERPIDALRLTKAPGVVPVYAELDKTQAEVTDEGDHWHIDLPARPSADRLTVRFRHEGRPDQFVLPIPTDASDSPPVPAEATVFMAKNERLFLPWGSPWTRIPGGWGSKRAALGPRGVIETSPAAVLRSHSASNVLRIYRVPVIAIVAVTAMTVLIGLRALRVITKNKLPIDTTVAAFALVAALFAASRIETPWAGAASLGILTESLVRRREKVRGHSGVDSVLIRTKPRESGFASAHPSRLAATVTTEPSTVLKYPIASGSGESPLVTDDPTLEIETAEQESPSRWSLDLEESASRLDDEPPRSVSSDRPS